MKKLIATLLCALLLSLVGGAISFALSRVNIIAGIAGLVSILLGYWGYCKFAGVKYSMKGLVIAIVLSVLVQIGAYYFSLAFELWMQLKDEIPRRYAWPVHGKAAGDRLLRL